METCTRLNYTFVKEEPGELSFGFTSLDAGQGIDQGFGGSNDPCSQSGVLTTTVEEMELKCFNNEELLEVKNHHQNVPQLVARVQRRPIIRKFTDHVQAMVIAKTYADLYSNNLPRLFPYQTLKCPTFLFQCPSCMLPCKSASPSAFLTLLCHVSKKHPDNSVSLFAHIMQQYAPFIEFMKKKIAFKTKSKYLLKLRDLEHRKNILKN